MAEIKEYLPTVIDNVDFPGVEQSSADAAGSAVTGKGNTSPGEIPERSYPSQMIANTVISDSFNTQSRRILDTYEFAKQGALQIGEYEDGVSGDIRISPNGILARNIDGDTTVSIDGSTGDITIKGTIAAGSLIAGRTDIGSTGGNVYISGDPPRIMVADGVNDRGLFGYDEGGF